jgi:serine/threonine protein kinase
MGHSDDFRLALAQEFKTLASLRHPHIISVLDYGFDKNRQPYLTMELLEDAPTLIGFGQDQPRPKQMALLVQVLQALAYLHRRGIIHRDLKPDNVLVINNQVRVALFSGSVGRGVWESRAGGGRVGGGGQGAGGGRQEWGALVGGRTVSP